MNWADTAGHYVMSLQRPDLHLDVDDDKEKAVATRKRIFDMVASEGIAIIGYHMPFPASAMSSAPATPIAGWRTGIS